jgi:hypothetical protein
MKKLLSIFLLAPGLAFSATTYYVSPSGSSGNSGLSTGAPWPIGYATTHVSSGDTILAMDGSYSSFTINTPNITIRAINKWAAIVNGAAGHGINPGSSATGITIDGWKVSNSGIDGIKSDADSYTIRNCWVTNSAAMGVGSHKHDDGIIEYCLIENNGLDGQLDHGIYVSGARIIIRNNVVRYNAHYGIQIYPEDTFQNAECKVYNNIVYGNAHIDNRGGGIVCWTDTASNVNRTNYFFCNTVSETGPEGALSVQYGTAYITNNILLSTAYRIQALGGVTVRNGYNLSANSFEVAGMNNVVSSTANFVSTGTGRYWLVSGSPSRSTALSTVLGPIDFWGNSQSSITDIGAVQYSVAQADDTRTLDPSPSGGADYWNQLVVSNPSGNIFTVGTLTIGP